MMAYLEQKDKKQIRLLLTGYICVEIYKIVYLFNYY